MTQTEQRQSFLLKILESRAPRKLIVAGPGTGKTSTFSQILRSHVGKKNLVLTFIRKLVEDMEKNFGELAEVKTFHAYCKKLLHEENGRIELVPFLTKIIESDSQNLDYDMSDFDTKFQMLEEHAEQIRFYLERGDYYEVVSFNDSVYRILTSVRKGSFELPKFNQIVIDEYQDFNPLEVSFIDELEKYGNILIVGDDDQAVYTGRNSSAEYLRQKFNSGDYEVFELPFCSRCPKVIVDAVNDFIENARENGLLVERITRPFQPFLEDKREINDRYPKIITARISTLPTVANYIRTEIVKIRQEDISHSWTDGDEYPTVLIVGRYHYISEIHKNLKQDYPFAKIATSEAADYTLSDGFSMLLRQENSNLGWRILAEILRPTENFRDILRQTLNGTDMIELLPREFIAKYEGVVELLRQKEITAEAEQNLKDLLEDDFDSIVGHFFAEKEEEQPVDKTKPSILLTSFQGCKGLSAGHVFIVGANEGEIPKLGEENELADVECCKFIVALTRTRRCCHILPNKWLNNPKTETGKWAKDFSPSRFLSMISSHQFENRGYIKASDLK